MFFRGAFQAPRPPWQSHGGAHPRVASLRSRLALRLAARWTARVETVAPLGRRVEGAAPSAPGFACIVTRERQLRGDRDDDLRFTRRTGRARTHRQMVVGGARLQEPRARPTGMSRQGFVGFSSPPPTVAKPRWGPPPSRFASLAARLAARGEMDGARGDRCAARSSCGGRRSVGARLRVYRDARAAAPRRSRR